MAVGFDDARLRYICGTIADVGKWDTEALDLSVT